jgi:hypothetical protein
LAFLAAVNRARGTLRDAPETGRSMPGNDRIRMLTLRTAFDIMVPALILAPDIGMLAYFIGPRPGAALYNLFHTLTVPLALGAVGLVAGQVPVALALQCGVAPSRVTLTNCADSVMPFGTSKTRLSIRTSLPLRRNTCNRLSMAFARRT